MAEEIITEEETESESEELHPELLERVELKTHQRIDQSLCGTLLELRVGYAKVELETTREMVVDEMGLVHGGFTFAAADFAAMAAVNDPNVVLVSSECRFLSPVKVGDRIVFEATELYKEARKRNIHVVGYFEDIKVFEGEFMAVVLERHVLKLKLVKDEA
ncbi:hotdog domain-containing protein [Hydrogenimonas urashimensis]|uniref:hotdog domain-containing protein n=1 Tax=Hydrogenimonas urashimensis TaxID=2740515 RepID=UPI0019168B45|nr:hotdog domain-containing protein [Hydrogenimonas urashimensis]